MGSTLRSIDGGLAGLAHGGGLGLTGKQEWMGVGILSRSNLICEEAGEHGEDQTGPKIPLSEEPGDTFVETEHQIVEEAHLGRCAAANR